jgi:hypothetical protein
MLVVSYRISSLGFFPQRVVTGGAKIEASGDEQGVATPLAIFSILKILSVSRKNKGIIAARAFKRCSKF